MDLLLAVAEMVKKHVFKEEMLMHVQITVMIMNNINFSRQKRMLFTPSSILFFAFILIIVFFQNCNSSSEELNNDIVSDLHELDIELIEEVGTNDAILFGRISNIIVLSDGTIIASDWEKLSLEQFDKKGNYVSTIASRGRGPGELPSFFYIFPVDEHSIILSHDGTTDLINYYVRNENGVFEYSNSWLPKKNDEYFIDIIQAITNSKYYALIKQKKSSILNDYNAEQYSYKSLAVVDREKILLSNELHELKEPNAIFDFGSNSMQYIGMPPYQSQDRFRYLGDGEYIIARPDSSKIYFYDKNHNLVESIYLQLERERVTEEDVEYFFKENKYSAKNRQRIESRIPSHKPSFLNLWLTRSKLFLNTDINENGKQITVLNITGEPVGFFNVSEFDRIQYIKSDTIYTVYQHPRKGYRIRLYKIDFF
ncbi:MAG: 6-bladed beta-propeller [Gracilimonas sp.]